MSDQKTAVETAGTTAGDPCARLLADLSDVLRSLGVPDGARDHFRSARLEMLKGIRALIDSRIDRLSAAAAKGTSVDIE